MTASSSVDKVRRVLTFGRRTPGSPASSGRAPKEEGKGPRSASLGKGPSLKARPALRVGALVAAKEKMKWKAGGVPMRLGKRGSAFKVQPGALGVVVGTNPLRARWGLGFVGAVRLDQVRLVAESRTPPAPPPAPAGGCGALASVTSSAAAMLPALTSIKLPTLLTGGRRAPTPASAESDKQSTSDCGRPASADAGKARMDSKETASTLSTASGGTANSCSTGDSSSAAVPTAAASQASRRPLRCGDGVLRKLALCGRC